MDKYSIDENFIRNFNYPGWEYSKMQEMIPILVQEGRREECIQKYLYKRLDQFVELHQKIKKLEPNDLDLFNSNQNLKINENLYKLKKYLISEFHYDYFNKKQNRRFNCENLKKEIKKSFSNINDTQLDQAIYSWYSEHLLKDKLNESLCSFINNFMDIYYDEFENVFETEVAFKIIDSLSHSAETYDLHENTVFGTFAEYIDIYYKKDENFGKIDEKLKFLKKLKEDDKSNCPPWDWLIVICKRMQYKVYPDRYEFSDEDNAIWESILSSNLYL